jgi:DNA/RNA endonuclease YhcR with UshA esterase domain
MKLVTSSNHRLNDPSMNPHLIFKSTRLFFSAAGAFLLLSCAFVGAAELPDLKPEQRAEILARKGEEVRVKGKVARVSTTSSGSITFINFEGIEMGGFSGVVHREDVAEIGRALGGSPRDVLTGKEIVLKGRVTLYDGKPQIEVRNASQIEVEGKVAAPPTSDLPSITNTPALRALEGKSVTLEGVVKQAEASKGGGILLISFEGVSAGGFMAVVTSSHLPVVEDAVGGNLDAALPGRKVSISGPISLYGQVPQIEIKTGDQIKVIP